MSLRSPYVVCLWLICQTLSFRLSLSAPALKLLTVEWAQDAFEWLFEFVSRCKIITPVARRKNSLILKLFKFIITNEMCTGEFNFGNKQVLIFTQCLLAFLLAQLVLPPPHSLETNKNNTHTHTRKQQLLRFLSSPLTIFPLFSLYSIVSTTTTTTTRASPTTTAKIIIFLNCEALREFFFRFFSFSFYLCFTRARGKIIIKEGSKKYEILKIIITKNT